MPAPPPALAGAKFYRNLVALAALFILGVTARRGQLGEPEINRDLSRFLFRQSVGICAGERFNQRAFAMIDMASCRNNAMPIGHGAHVARMASTTRSS